MKYLLMINVPSAEPYQIDGWPERDVQAHLTYLKRLNHELALIRMTGNTLVMQVQQIVANDSFGAVLGALQVDKQGKRLEMPFCGLWRFRSGRIIEHWGNAYDISAFGQFLLGEVASNPFEGRSS